jgi:hypothetical protein
MKICVAGQGAFGIKHLEAVAQIPGIEVVSLAGGNPAGTEEVARKFGITSGLSSKSATKTKILNRIAERKGRHERGEVIGLLVNDDRDPQQPVTILAERGAFASSAQGSRVIMVNGSRQRFDRATGKLSVLTFERYTLDLAVLYVAMIIVGGMGSILGALMGAVFITLLPYGIDNLLEYLPRAWRFGSTVFGVQVGAVGICIILFLLFEPKGLAEIWRRVETYFDRWPFRYRPLDTTRR